MKNKKSPILRREVGRARIKKQKVSKKILVVYHMNCMDGFTAAWAAWKKFGNRAEYVPAGHYDLPVEIPRGKDIYFLDIAFPPAVTRALQRKENRVTILDHHVSVKDYLYHADEHRYGVNNSGCVLAWKFFFPDKKIPKLFEYIEAVDLWESKPKHAREVFTTLGLFEGSFHKWNRLVKDFERASFRKRLIAQGKLLMRKQDQFVKTAIEQTGMPVKFEGRRIFAVNSPNFASQIGSVLSKQHPPLGIIWSQIKDGGYLVNLRSNGKVDVSEIAKKYGGGGHKAASGFYLKPGIKFPWEKVT